MVRDAGGRGSRRARTWSTSTTSTSRTCRSGILLAAGAGLPASPTSVDERGGRAGPRDPARPRPRPRSASSATASSTRATSGRGPGSRSSQRQGRRLGLLVRREGDRLGPHRRSRADEPLTTEQYDALSDDRAVRPTRNARRPVPAAACPSTTASCARSRRTSSCGCWRPSATRSPTWSRSMFGDLLPARTGRARRPPSAATSSSSRPTCWTTTGCSSRPRSGRATAGRAGRRQAEGCRRPGVGAVPRPRPVPRQRAGGPPPRDAARRWSSSATRPTRTCSGYPSTARRRGMLRHRPHADARRRPAPRQRRLPAARRAELLRAALRLGGAQARAAHRRDPHRGAGRRCSA
ncbi:MAG: hypothetical protein MZV63_06020 [Marinilabiliales bacterium]|nr:hypothetical protein [Marinilabiliales bacterium]